MLKALRIEFRMWWAKFRYWRSIGFDTSECFTVPSAWDKEIARRRLLRQRIGDFEYAIFARRYDLRPPPQ
jgi:hypothetical protein